MSRLNSTAFRFWLITAILIVVGTFSLGGILYWKGSTSLENALRSEGATAASTISSAIGLSMLQENYSSMNPLVYSLLDQPNVQFVKIVDAEGTVVSQKGETVTDEKVLVERVPISYFQTDLGEVEIGLMTTELRKQQLSLFFYVIGITVVICALAVLISSFVSRHLLLPLTDLANAVKLIGAGYLDVKVPEKGTNEIIKLSKSFNNMATTIREHESILQTEIKRATHSLTEKIDTLETLGNIAGTTIENELSKVEAISVLLQYLGKYFPNEVLSFVLLEKREEVTCFTGECIRHERRDYLFGQTEIPDVLSTSRPTIRKLTEVNRTNWEEELYQQGFRSIMIVPLMARQRVIGTLIIKSVSDNHFRGKKFEDIELFAHQAAMIIDRAEAYESLRDSAFYDFLTGLANHRKFKETVSETLAADESRAKVFAVMLLDLDRFKSINDTFGHDFGNEVLKEVGGIMTDCIGDHGMVARIGGDEFAVLLNDINEPNDALRIGNTISDALQKPFILNGYEIHVTASIGISLFPQDGTDGDVLFKHADMAMYRVKEFGKNNVALFTPTGENDARDQYNMENDLHKALIRREFLVFYQPKINIQTGTITGMEALVRWQHPVRGLVPPDMFIPLAEETGLIVPLGEYVLRTAVKQAVEWHKSGEPFQCISVNLSTRQFLQSNLVETVRSIIDETGIDPSYLDLEITESMTMDFERAIPILKELKRLGVMVSIDDFGTGYSSLAYLRELPIDCLKIDRSFITDIVANEDNAAIVTTIINMAHNLHLNVIAEGVETEEQVALLQQKHCQVVQGYYFSKPLPADEITSGLELLRKKATRWKQKQMI